MPRFNIFNREPMTNDPGPFANLTIVGQTKEDCEHCIHNVLKDDIDLDLQRDKVTPPKRKGDDKRNGKNGR